MRAGCMATETTSGSGFAWTNTSPAISFISDGSISIVLHGSVDGLLDDDDVDADMSGAEVRSFTLLLSL
jgi:hypothetical protein